MKKLILVLTLVCIAFVGALASKSNSFVDHYWFNPNSGNYEPVTITESCPNLGEGCLVLIQGQLRQIYIFDNNQFKPIKP
jgi:hypothetical protein